MSGLIGLKAAMIGSTEERNQEQTGPNGDNYLS